MWFKSLDLNHNHNAKSSKRTIHEFNTRTIGIYVVSARHSLTADTATRTCKSLPSSPHPVLSWQRVATARFDVTREQRSLISSGSVACHGSCFQLMRALRLPAASRDSINPHCTALSWNDFEQLHVLSCLVAGVRSSDRLQDMAVTLRMQDTVQAHVPARNPPRKVRFV